MFSELTNSGIKQPVRALERAKAKAILDARKFTAAAKTTARTAQIGGRAAEGTARQLGAAISRALGSLSVRGKQKHTEN